MGNTFAGRVAASVLQAAGLPELVTGSLEEFEASALRLARNPAQLSAFAHGSRKIARRGRSSIRPASPVILNLPMRPCGNAGSAARHLQVSRSKPFRAARTPLRHNSNSSPCRVADSRSSACFHAGLPRQPLSCTPLLPYLAPTCGVARLGGLTCRYSPHLDDFMLRACARAVRSERRDAFVYVTTARAMTSMSSTLWTNKVVQTFPIIGAHGVNFSPDGSAGLCQQ